MAEDTLTDSHAHLDAYGDELPAVVERARAAGVGTIVAIGGGAEANRAAIAAAESFPGCVWAVAGYDRHLADSDEADLSALEPLLAHPRVVGVGETGLDYHYEPDQAPQQRALFERMLDAARRHTLPVVVHCRLAEADALERLREHARLWRGPPDALGVVHCFTGDRDFARQVLDLGMMIGISGIVTFRNADALRAVAADIPEERLLIETDSPYLAPVPYRGKRNEPAWVREVAQTLAGLRRTTTERIARDATRNARRLFGNIGRGTT